jgi:hypothetical protein
MDYEFIGKGSMKISVSKGFLQENRLERAKIRSKNGLKPDKNTQRHEDGSVNEAGSPIKIYI